MGTFRTHSLLILILTLTSLCHCHGSKVKNTQKSDTDPDASHQSKYQSPLELELFAFGVTAQLGSLYDIRTQTFLNTTIFSSHIFNDELVITEGQESTYESEGLVEKPSDEFRLLDLHPRQALGILLGQGAAIPSRGSTGFLWNVDHQGADDSNGAGENGEERIDGAFKYSIKYLKTAEERLNLKHVHLPFGIDFVKLKETRATHVLIKIQYGVGLTVRIPLSTPRLFNSKAKMNWESMDSHQEDSLSSLLRFSTSANEGPEVFTDMDLEDLTMELEKIKNKQREKSAVTFDEKVEDEVEFEIENGTEIPATTNSSVKTRENSKKKKFSRADAEALLRTFPHHLNGFRKGIPLKYVLVSVRDFLKNFIDDDSTELTDIPQPAYPNSQLDYYNLERALSTFDGITLMRRTLAQLEQNVERHQSLLRDDDLRRIAITKRHFVKTSNQLKRELKQTLANSLVEESQTQSQSQTPEGHDLNRKVSSLLETYYENVYSFANVNDSLRSVEFKHALETMKLLGYIKSAGVVYLGRGATVDQLRLSGNEKEGEEEDSYGHGLFQDKGSIKRTYILFFKDLATVSAKLKWLQTRSLFFNLRFHGGLTNREIGGLNKLIVIDCNFAWAFEECENIWDQPVIHEYHGNRLITDNYPNKSKVNVYQFGSGLNSTINNISDRDVSVMKSLTRRLVEQLHVLKRSGNRVLNEVQVFHNEGENSLKTQGRGQLRDLTYSLRGTLYNIQYELVEAEEEIQNFLRFFLSLSTEKQTKVRTSIVKTGLPLKNKSSSKTKVNSSLTKRSRSGTRRRNSRARSEAFTFPTKNSDSNLSSNQDSKQEKATKRRKSNVKLNKKHSSQSACHIIESGITLAERKEIVDRHNVLRKFVASGMETRGISGPQPAALFMATLQWDEELAKEAQKVADTCQTQSNQQKSKQSSLQSFGQNVKVRGNFFNHTRKNFALPSDWTGTIDRWYEQVASFDSKNVGKFESHPSTNTDAYSQMVWAQTNRIGCGYTQFAAKNDKGQDGVRRLYVCNYNPKGNHQDQPVYTIRKRG